MQAEVVSQPWGTSSLLSLCFQNELSNGNPYPTHKSLGKIQTTPAGGAGTQSPLNLPSLQQITSFH